MQQKSFPFNQNEHIFDFKVKVDFQNGNVSLTAPQGIVPPASFNTPHQNNQFNPSHNIYTSPHVAYQMGNPNQQMQNQPIGKYPRQPSQRTNQN
jgi:hypothetical protein